MDSLYRKLFTTHNSLCRKQKIAEVSAEPKYRISSIIRQNFFVLPKQSQNLDTSYKMDQDFRIVWEG